MRLYNLPTELYSGVVEGLPELVSQSVTGVFLENWYMLACTYVVLIYPVQFPALTVPQGEAVYDFCWYPKMNSWEPETCW